MMIYFKKSYAQSTEGNVYVVVWYLRFANGYDVPWMSVSFSCLLLFVNLFLALRFVGTVSKV
jgi:hypothetical protein